MPARASGSSGLPDHLIACLGCLGFQPGIYCSVAPITTRASCAALRISEMGCSSSKSPEDVGATPNQPLPGEPSNAIKKGARIVILGAAAGSKCPLGSAQARLLCLLSEHLTALGGSIHPE